MSRLGRSLKFRLQKWQVVALCLVAILIVGGLVFTLVNNNKAQPERKIIFNDEDDAKSAEDQLVNIPKDAKSAVCDTFPLDQLEKLLGQKTNGARVSLPNTATKEGSVSSCTYIVAGEQAQSIKSVMVTTRDMRERSAADSAYAILTKSKDENRKSLGRDAFYNLNSRQLVAIKGTKLHVVTLTISGDPAPEKELYEKLLKLL